MRHDILVEAFSGDNNALFLYTYDRSLAVELTIDLGGEAERR